MQDMLYNRFDDSLDIFGSNAFKNKILDKDWIVDNLNPTFLIREYQKEALGRFIYYCEDYSKKQKPIHLMFNMATGSGKTLIMAANILYLYKRGYRNFIFFTRLGNIIQKTKDNFLNLGSKKYLFADKIVIDGKEVDVKEVENFDGTNECDINIIFSTTALLHSRFNSAKENSITFEDFSDKKIVLIADEAHNLSSETTNGKLNKEDEFDKNSWEKTVLKILDSNISKDNVLLEFTATARLEQEYPEILEKYKDKAIFRYDLKHYRLDGFSKDVKTVSIDAKLIERVLTAVIISQYRRKIAEKNGIYLKPVILFKANRVTSPKSLEDTRGANPKIVVSSEFKEKFHELIFNLKTSDLDILRRIENNTLKQALNFFENQKITLENLINELKIDFAPEKCLTVDDDKDVEKKQILLNSLEDKNNEVRAIFAVEKLNEGWDVLNLFDIVRLYDTRDAKANKAGKTTVSEAQLIGRGARYYPFITTENKDLYRRKFDENSNNELRILEQLFYYSANNPKYIQELTDVLVKEGIIASNKIEREIKVKDDFKKNDLWKNGLIFLNGRRENCGENVSSFSDLDIKFDYNADWNIYKLMSYDTEERDVFTGKMNKSNDRNIITKEYSLVDFGQSILRTAINKLPGFNFSDLSKKFGNLKSISEFINDKKYLGSVKVKVSGHPDGLDGMSQRQKLHLCLFVLERIFKNINEHSSEYIGERLFRPYKISEIFKDKVLQLDSDSHRAQELSGFNFSDKKWFAQNEIWGTSEEESFINFFDSVVNKLNGKYEDISLLRNEQHFKIYSFDEGLAFSPDFALFLKEKKSKKEMIYQVFIEPKGDQFLDKDGKFDQSQEGWKQKFLTEIEKIGKVELKFENKDFKLFGLPFFNEGNSNKKLKDTFEKSFDEKFINN